MKLSFCFTHKNRLKLETKSGILPLFMNCLSTLRNCLESIDFNDYEIIISSWDNEKDFKKLKNFTESVFKNNHVKLIQSEASENFTRGGGRNKSLEMATGDVIAFIDADMLFVRPNIILKGLECVDRNLSYFPICFSLNKDGTGEWRPTGLGNCFLKKSILKNIKWKEKSSWGKEDDWFYENINKVSKVYRDNCPGWYHQWHPPTDLGDY